MTYELKYDDKFKLYLHKKIKFRGGAQYLFRFENGYGASIVKHRASYGYENDLWELAVIIWSDAGDMFKLNYDTSITPDVVEWLNDEAVNYFLEKIMQLNELGELDENEVIVI